MRKGRLILSFDMNFIFMTLYHGRALMTPAQIPLVTTVARFICPFIEITKKQAKKAPTSQPTVRDYLAENSIIVSLIAEPKH
ncbi:hypothetical protein [Laceyella tengchongensis]|uniref:hypothetical protein n=1 Tax=Laceyella tengchongensis TaxID=574699 RepID=UPI002546945B|nr:hypothetical protein [Laceyella tengchongensis]